MFTQAVMERGLTLWSETDRMDKPQGSTQTTSDFFFYSHVGGVTLLPEAAGECVVTQGIPEAETPTPPTVCHHVNRNHHRSYLN